MEKNKKLNLKFCVRKASIMIIFVILTACGYAANMYELYINKNILFITPENMHAGKVPRISTPAAKKIMKNITSSAGLTAEQLISSKYVSARYRKALKLVTKPEIKEKIERISKIYGLEPSQVAGAIIAEHTFNVDMSDNLQDFLISAYSKWVVYGDKNNGKLAELLSYKEFSDFKKKKNDYEKWEYVMDVWERQFRGKTKYNQLFPNQRFVFVYFNPYGVGKTYGIGQLSPLRVLMANDIANKIGKIPRIEYYEHKRLYQAVLNPEVTIHYICATIYLEKKYYKEIAGFDISKNMGIIATLYNIGNEKKHAQMLFEENRRKIGISEDILFPEENFFGWFVNEHSREIKEYFD